MMKITRWWAVFTAVLFLFLVPTEAKRNTNKRRHQRICPPRKLLLRLQQDESISESVHSSFDYLKRLCEEGNGVSAPDAQHLRHRLLQSIGELLAMNITRQMYDEERHLTRSCPINTLPSRTLNKVYRCFGLKRLSKLTKKMKRPQKPAKAARLLLDFLTSAYIHWHQIHEHSKESSRSVWNEELLDLESRAGQQLLSAYTNAFLYVKAKLKQRIGCVNKRMMPSINFHADLRRPERKMAACLQLALFHTIESGFRSATDLLDVRES